ncbi:membrane protein [Cladorrhinum sp. PSN332]|nr:membrane protein [Cladorrhinum sp. PSN332]
MDSSPSSSQNRPSSPPAPSPSPSKPSKLLSYHRRREYNLYDAVAGKITPNGPLYSYPPTHPHSQSSHSGSKPRRHSFSRAIPRLAPEDVLFRRKNAPTRFAESDVYWASEDLAEGAGVRLLPESELLVCLHSYVSKFYDFAGAREGEGRKEERRVVVDERSMDETALLALGILLEEAGREVLGRKGERVFVEGEVEEKGVEGVKDRGEGGNEGEKGEAKRMGVKRRKLSGRKWEEDEEMEM